MACKFCSALSPAYVCPRCSAAYCSVVCYKSKKHIDCSEIFYKKCVEEECRCKTLSKTETEKVKEALSRDFAQKSRDMGCELSTRFSDIDIDDSDSVMQVLTAEERETFAVMLSSERIAELVPLWEPWWIEKRKLVEEVKNYDSEFFSSSGYERKRRIPRLKVAGKKVHPVAHEIGCAEGSEQAPRQELDYGKTTENHIQSHMSCGSSTSIIDPRYKPDRDCRDLTHQKHKLTVEIGSTPHSSQKLRDENLSLKNEAFCSSERASTVFRTKCANVINLTTSFTFIARYFNGILEGELMGEIGKTFCSVCLVLQAEECSEIACAIEEVLSKPVVLNNVNRVLLIDDVRTICSSKHFIRKALMKTGKILKSYAAHLKRENSAHWESHTQALQKLRYKVHYYADWIDESFIQFKKYIGPHIELHRIQAEALFQN